MTRSARLLTVALIGLILSCDEGRLVTEADSEPFQAMLETVTGPDTVYIGRPAAYSTAVTVGGEVVTADVIRWRADPSTLLSFDTTEHTSAIQVQGRAPGTVTLEAAIDHPDLAPQSTTRDLTVVLYGVAPVTPAAGDTTLTAIGESFTVRAHGVGDNQTSADSAGLSWTHVGSALSVTPPLQGRDTLRVEAVAIGTDTLTFRQDQGLCVEGPCMDTIFVHVTPTPARVEAEDSLRLTTLGRTATPAVTVFDANDNAIPGAPVSWSLVDPGDTVTAVVDGEGTVTARGNGAARIRAAAGSASDTVEVLVSQVIHRVVATADLTLTALGATDTVSLTATDSGGAPVTRPFTVEWVSRDSGIVRVGTTLADGRAVVTGEANGATHVIGEAESRADSVEVTVVQTAASVTVAPTSVTLDALGATAQLDATVTDAQGSTVPDAAVSWSAVDSGIVTVSASGLVTGVAVGATAVTASSGDAAATATVTVQQVPASIAVTDTVILTALGDRASLDPTVKDAEGAIIPDASVTWVRVSGIDVVDVTGTDSITAKANGQAEVEGSAGDVADTAVVRVFQTVDSVAVVTGSLAYTAFLSADTVEVSAFDPGGALVTRPFDVLWSSSAPDVAAVTQLADTTRAQIQAVSDGAARIDATVEEKTDSVTVTVAQTVDSVVITPAADTLNAIGFTAQLSARPVDANLQDADAAVTWTGLDTLVATIDGSGTVTAAAPGTARFTAAAGGVEDTASLVVRQIAESVVVSPDPIPDTLLADEQIQLAVAVTDSNGHAISTPDVRWTASPDSVATVNASGRVTAAPVSALDSAWIGATSGPAADSVPVFVNTAVLTSVSVTPTPDTIAALTDTAQLVAQGLNQNGNPISGETFSWQSRDTNVVTVEAATGVVTAEANGQTYVIATSDTDPGLMDSALVVVEQVPTGVTIDPATYTFNALGDTHTFTATAADARGQTVTDATFSWSAGLSGKLSHLGGGQFQADAVTDSAARAIVSVTGVPGVADTALVTIRQVPAAIAITPTADTTPVNATVSLAATVSDANGNAIPTAGVTWTALDAGIATVDESGTVTGVGVGDSARIVAFPTDSPSTAVQDTAYITVAAYTLAFDGADYVDVGDNLALTAGWTVELWVKPTAVTGTQYLMAKGGATSINQGSYGVYLSGANPAVYIRSGAGGRITELVATSASLTAGAWSHLAVTYDGAMLRYYVNGAPVDSTASTDTPQASTDPLVLGGSNTTPADAFTGSLDEFRFWGDVRTAEEVAAAYQAPLTGTEAGLTAYWPFDEGAGGITLDVTGGLSASLGTATVGDAAEPSWTAESPTIP